MADTVVHIGENSPEYVAYQLMQLIFQAEEKHGGRGGGLDRRTVIDTYAECLSAVRNPAGHLAARRQGAR